MADTIDKRAKESTDQEIRRPRTLAFVITFGLLIALSEGLLRLVAWAQDAVGWALIDHDIDLLWAGFAAALVNAIFTYTGLVALFAFFEWRHLGFKDFRRRYAEGLLYGATAIVIAVMLQTAAFSSLQTLDFEPVFQIQDLGPVSLLFPIIYMVIIGFFEYWLHRALHDVPFLWRLHAIHHQIEDMNAARSYSHWAQDAVYLAVITVPLIFLVESPQGFVALLTTFYLISNYYMHTDNPALSFPPILRHVLADNVYHHYHHSRRIEHWGRNYCSFFSFYDRIFGTQHMPRDETFHATGIDGYAPLENWRDYLIRPFTNRGKT